MAESAEVVEGRVVEIGRRVFGNRWLGWSVSSFLGLGENEAPDVGRPFAIFL